MFQPRQKSQHNPHNRKRTITGPSFNSEHVMSKSHAYSLVLVLVIIGAFGLANRVQRAEAQPVIYYYIRADGSIEPSTTLIISADNITYTLTDNITGSIIVQRNNIVIDGSGYTLQGYGGSYNENGFSLFDVNNVTIKDTVIENFYWGVYLNSTNDIVVSGNCVMNNQQDGIGSFVSSNNLFLGNNISGNSFSGVTVDGSSSNNIVGNNITRNGANGKGGIWLNGSSNNSVVGNYIEDNAWRGILLDGSLNNSITGNNITYNEYGILLQNSSSNSIVENDVTGNPYGIRIHSFSDNNSVVGNNLAHNVFYGIFLFYASNNIVSGNNITNNTFHGIRLDGSLRNRIVKNNITDNPNGVYLYPCSDNLFYYNNFLNNTVQVYLTSEYLTFGCVNTWDNGYPLGGNYWSDYTGIDVKSGPNQNETGSDGIGDTPYDINSNNTDRYPLMTPFKTEPFFTSILSPENKTYAVNTDIALTLTVNKPTTWIGYSLDSQANVTITGNTTLPVLSDGSHYVVVYANDTFGNIRSNTVFFVVDTVSPTINILSPENKTYTTEDVSLNFTVSESTSWIGYSLDSIANTTITGNTSLTGLPDGTHNIMLYASDIAGNTGFSDMVYFTIDTTPPSISIVSPENKTYDTTALLLTFTLDESASWMAYSLDGHANVTITGNTTLTTLSDGRYYIIIYANDTFGNMGASNTVYFAVDTTAPNITGITQLPLPNNVLPTDKVEVNATVTDNLGIKRVTLNYTWTNSTGTWTQVVTMTNTEGNFWNATIPAFPYGTNVTYVITAEDNAGNTVTSEESGYKCQYQVTPESSSFLILPPFMIATLLAAMTHRRKARGDAPHNHSPCPT